MPVPTIDTGTVETFSSDNVAGADDVHTVPFPSGTADGDMVVMAVAYSKVAVPNEDVSVYARDFRGVGSLVTTALYIFDPGGTTESGTTQVTIDISSPAGNAGLAAVTCRLEQPSPPSGRSWDVGGDGEEATTNQLTDFTFDPNAIEPEFLPLYNGFVDGSEDILFLQAAGIAAQSEDPIGEVDTMPSAPSGWTAIGDEFATHLVVGTNVQTVRVGLYAHTGTSGPTDSEDFPEVTIGSPHHSGVGYGVFYPLLAQGAYWGYATQRI